MIINICLNASDPDSYSSGLLRLASEYVWISSALLRIPHLYVRRTEASSWLCHRKKI